jgi:hypothetical protein
VEFYQKGRHPIENYYYWKGWWAINTSNKGYNNYKLDFVPFYGRNHEWLNM